MGTRYPFGNEAAVTEDAATGATSVSVNAASRYIKLTNMAGTVTLNLDIDDDVEIGHQLVIQAIQDGTGRNVTTGTGFSANCPDLTGVANDTDQILVEYDGSAYNSISGWVKTVDAA